MSGDVRHQEANAVVIHGNELIEIASDFRHRTIGRSDAKVINSGTTSRKNFASSSLGRCFNGCNKAPVSLTMTPPIGTQSTSQSGGNMKTRTILLTLLLCFVGAAVCFADDPQMGTWKLNEAKSKIGAGSPKITTSVYEAAGDSVKATLDGTDGDGKPLHSEWTGKFDGKDYPVTGDPNTDTRSYKKVNDHTLASTNKKGDKVTITARGVVSADGKTRTVTITGTDSKGKKFTSTAVYDKQ